MSRFPVAPAKEKGLVERMQRLGVKESAIEEKVIRSSGPGGQNVNKTSTCVFLSYPPLNIRVKCQEGRSLVLNRFLARRILLEKIEKKILGERSAEEARIQKIRRQKRRRSRRAKEKMLADKACHSIKKIFRKIGPYDLE